jgi:hypothetical protein
MATVLPIAQRGEAILKLQAAPVAQLSLIVSGYYN